MGPPSPEGSTFTGGGPAEGHASRGPTQAPRARVAALLFGSGMAALAYQIAWQREFRLVFGSSTAASAAVLAIFIGGMGAGGLVLGRRSDAPNPGARRG